jgi:NAD(P)-dependent dehydrogenase (short-subunit alcohol dehydrogenase family)
MGQLNPLQRHGQPIEIASAMACRASDDASDMNVPAFDGWWTGQRLPFSKQRKVVQVF